MKTTRSLRWRTSVAAGVLTAGLGLLMAATPATAATLSGTGFQTASPAVVSATSVLDRGVTSVGAPLTSHKHTCAVKTPLVVFHVALKLWGYNAPCCCSTSAPKSDDKADKDKGSKDKDKDKGSKDKDKDKDKGSKDKDKGNNGKDKSCDKFDKNKNDKDKDKYKNNKDKYKNNKDKNKNDKDNCDDDDDTRVS